MEIEVFCICSDQVEPEISQVPFDSGTIGFERQIGCTRGGLQTQWVHVPGVMQR